MANGMGGIDWAGLQVVVALLGVEDLEDLLFRLEVIRTHNPPERAQGSADGPRHPVD